MANEQAKELQAEGIKAYPSTSEFPGKPEHLTRENLEHHYLTLRGHYKGLMISRGQFATKNRRIQNELEKYHQEQSKLVAQLSTLAQERKELYEVAKNLQELTARQDELMQEFKGEFEVIRDDRSNLMNPANFIERFNRIMRAAYRLLNEGVMPKPKEIKKSSSGDLDSTSPGDLWRDIHQNK
jgi:chromosome segregation ATPase